MRPAVELFVILLLGASLLTASFPFYASLAATPEDLFFGSGVYVLNQASSGQPLTEALAEELRSQPWSTAVSPEVYALIGLSGQAVVVRGVQLDSFLRLEGLPLGAAPGPEFLFLGERLSLRLGLGVGDPMLLPGSTSPLLMEATVDGVLRAEGAPADEVIMDLPRTRRIAGLGSTSLTLLRVGTDEVTSLLAYLATNEKEVLVSGEGETRLVRGGLVFDDRIGSLILTNPALGQELGRTYIGSFAQHSGNSLSVLVIGMEALTVLLLGVMMGSTLTRYWVERRRDVGVLRALGGGGPGALRLFGIRLLAIGVLASFVGLIAGVGMGLLLESAGTYSFLGHALRYDLGTADLLLLAGLYLTAFAFIALAGLLFLLRQPPRDLLHEGPEPSWKEPEAGPAET
ncbi:MAG: FtsX-like permease family protein [Thermoplasmata archaeon]